MKNTWYSSLPHNERMALAGHALSRISMAQNERRLAKHNVPSSLFNRVAKKLARKDGAVYLTALEA